MLTRFLLAAALAASDPSPDAAPLPPSCITVVSTSDLHGTVEAREIPALGATRRLRYGGLEGVAAYVDALRSRFGDRMVLLDSGDMYQGTLAGRVSRGKAIIDAYNLLGYRAAALGNHELDFGALEPGDPDVHGVVKRRISEARFPFLALNLFDRATGRRVDWPNTRGSVLLDVAGIELGVIGIVTDEMPRITRPSFMAGLEVHDPAPLVAEEAKALRAAGAQAVVLLAHAGGNCADLSRPHDVTSCERGAELFRLLERLPAGTVDAALGGHTHGRVAHFVHGTAVVVPAPHGQQLGRVDLCMGPDGRADPGRTRIHRPIDLCLDEWLDGGCSPHHAPAATRRARFMGNEVIASAALDRIMKPYIAEARTAWSRSLGARLPRPLLRDGEPPLGDIICEAVARASGTPIVVLNRGGVRADLREGPLRFGQVFEVLPFENHIAVLGLTGEQLVAFVRLLASRPYVAGLELRGPDGRLDVRLAGGAPGEAQRVYAVATNDFLAQGGDGAQAVLGALAPERLRVLDATVLQALIDHLQRLYPDRRAVRPRRNAVRRGATPASPPAP